MPTTNITEKLSEVTANTHRQLELTEKGREKKAKIYNKVFVSIFLLIHHLIESIEKNMSHECIPIGSDIRISAFSGNSTSSTLPFITCIKDDITQEAY